MRKIFFILQILPKEAGQEQEAINSREYMKNKRHGMLGALLDEYERAAQDLKTVLFGMSSSDFTAIRDAQTTDPDCHSVQTIITHVVRSGYGYAAYINSMFKEERYVFEGTILSPNEGMRNIDAMLLYTEKVLLDKMDIPLEEIATWKFDTRWGPTYDIEQLLEHAIVHILRHRRQIEHLMEMQ